MKEKIDRFYENNIANNENFIDDRSYEPWLITKTKKESVHNDLFYHITIKELHLNNNISCVCDGFFYDYRKLQLLYVKNKYHLLKMIFILLCSMNAVEWYEIKEMQMDYVFMY